jgi:hypothetical protein
MLSIAGPKTAINTNAAAHIIATKPTIYQGISESSTVSLSFIWLIQTSFSIVIVQFIKLTFELVEICFSIGLSAMASKRNYVAS